MPWIAARRARPFLDLCPELIPLSFARVAGPPHRSNPNSVSTGLGSEEAGGAGAALGGGDSSIGALGAIGALGDGRSCVFALTRRARRRAACFLARTAARRRARAAWMISRSSVRLAWRGGAVVFAAGAAAATPRVALRGSTPPPPTRAKAAHT